MKSLLSVSIALLLPLTAGAFPFRHTPPGTSQSAQAGSHAQQPASEIQGRAGVDPKLLHKKVVVHLRDGRVFEGKLVELTNDFIRLKMDKRTETISLTELASVDRRKKRNWKLPLVIALAALAVTGIIVGAVVTGEGD